MTADASALFILVAGEASGDQLGAGLIIALRDLFPAARFGGIGGPRMAAAGMDIWHPAEKLSVMGLVEVLPHLPHLLAIRRDVYKRTLRQHPDAFIGIDAPDFNLGLELRLKRTGIRTVHYVSPSVWAWKEKRAAKLGRSADRVLCLFPMEPAIYARHGVDARFVGHPLADAFPMQPDQAAARRELGLPPEVPVLALLPGSRLGEIRRLGAAFLDTAALILQQLPQLHIVAPMANAACRVAFDALPQKSALGAALQVVDGNAHQAMIAADAVLLASGTAALEAMLAKRPMVVAYRLAPLTYRIVKWLRLMRTNVYSLPNILAGGTPVVAELMQDACTPPALSAALLPFLRSRVLPQETLATFQRLHGELRGDADRRAAAVVAELIQS